MRGLIIQFSIAVLTLLVPEIWRDTFEWLRQSRYWRYIQIAVMCWILIVAYIALPWSSLERMFPGLAAPTQNRTVATTPAPTSVPAASERESPTTRAIA